MKRSRHLIATNDENKPSEVRLIEKLKSLKRSKISIETSSFISLLEEINALKARIRKSDCKAKTTTTTTTTTTPMDPCIEKHQIDMLKKIHESKEEEEEPGEILGASFVKENETSTMGISVYAPQSNSKQDVTTSGYVISTISFNLDNEDDLNKIITFNNGIQRHIATVRGIKKKPV